MKSENTTKYWTVEEIRPYIIEELKKRFPDSIIVRESGNVDIMVLGPNVPVEIQRTYNRNGTVHIAIFEDNTRRQTEINIEICGTCWIFMDDKFLNHLQNNLVSWASINMDWFYQFWKDRKLRIFTITMEGIIRELLEDREFDFIKKGKEQRILEKNKYMIEYKVLKRKGFTTEEIIGWYDEYEKDNLRNKNLHFSDWLKRIGGRKKELGNIIYAIGHVSAINEMLKCKGTDNGRATVCATDLGILMGNDSRGSRYIICSDEYNVLEDLPGYFEKKELWDYWKMCTVDNKMFNIVVRGEYADYLKDRKKQKDIEEAWA